MASECPVNTPPENLQRRTSCPLSPQCANVPRALGASTHGEFRRHPPQHLPPLHPPRFGSPKPPPGCFVDGFQTSCHGSLRHAVNNYHRQLQTNIIQPLQVPPHGVFIRGFMPEHAAIPRQNTLEKIVPESYPLACPFEIVPNVLVYFR